MSSKAELIHMPDTNPPATPATLLDIAVRQGADLQKLEKLMELQERWEKNEARKAYNVAVAAFKANPPKVTKDKENKQYKSMYTSIGNMVNTANPELSKHGLYARWDIEQSDCITVTCVLSHVLGHSERVSMSGLADNSGQKNALQQIKSTVTYLKISTFEAITGLASTDAVDDDGNSATIELISENQVADLKAKIEDVGADPVAFKKFLKVDEFEELPLSKYSAAIKALEDKAKGIRK